MPTRRLKATARRLLRRLGYEVHRLGDCHFFHSLLDRRLRRTTDFFFIEIGAHDGVRFDPIYSFVTENRLAGLVVEPLPDVFAQLVDNYRNFPQVIPVNAAIHRTEKSMTMYRVAPGAPNLPAWARGIASFHQDHHRLSGIPSAQIVTEEVRCMSLSELVAQHRVERIDLLQIDAEGYDDEIIKMIDFQALAPHIVRFEHGYRSRIMSWERLSECLKRLLDNGYLVNIEERDAVAYRPD